MSDLKLERKESMTRKEVGELLSALANAFNEGGDSDLEVAGFAIALRVPDDVRTEFELEVDGTEIEMELELKWSTAEPPAEKARPDSAAVDASDGSASSATAETVAATAAQPRASATPRPRKRSTGPASRR